LALTNQQAYELAIRQMQIEPLRLPSFFVFPLIQGALEKFAKRVMDGPDWANLQKTFTYTFTAAGVINLADASLARMLFDQGKSVIQEPNATTRMLPADSFEQLQYGDLDKTVYWFAQRGPLLHVRDRNGALATLPGVGAQVGIVSNFVPLIGEVPDDTMRGGFIQTLVEQIQSGDVMKAALDSNTETQQGRN
jgi:hypothetical protein